MKRLFTEAAGVNFKISPVRFQWFRQARVEKMKTTLIKLRRSLQAIVPIGTCDFVGGIGKPVQHPSLRGALLPSPLQASKEPDDFHFVLNSIVDMAHF